MIHFVAETGSTSDDLATRLRAGEAIAEGDWLVADRQTAGRGRGGRAWLDGSGNFMGSTLVRLCAGDPEPPTLALVAGLAVHQAVSAYLPSNRCALLKWPNDVTVDGAKLAGILMEREGNTIVIGVGVNLRAAPVIPARETVALATLGAAPHREAFAVTLAGLFEQEITRWRAFGVAPIVKRWLAAAHAIGTALLVGEPGEEPLAGTFAGLTDSGALQLRLADGATRAIHAGDVRFASPDE